MQRKMDMVSVEHCLIHDLLLEFSVEFSSGTTSRLGGRLWKVPFDRAVTALEVDMPTASASNYWVLNLFLSVSLPSLRPSGVGESCESRGSGGELVVTCCNLGNMNLYDFYMNIYV